MGLGADAIVLVFHRRVLKIAQRLCGRFDGTREHEVDGMKETESRIGQLSRRGQTQRFAEIAKQHVGAFHAGQAGASKARAMASSTRLSFRPMRRSPLIIFTMYLASSGVARSRSRVRRAALAAGPRAAAISEKTRCTAVSDSARFRPLREAPRRRPIRHRHACDRSRSVRARIFPRVR